MSRIRLSGLPAGDVEIVCRGLPSQHAAVARDRRRSWKASSHDKGIAHLPGGSSAFGERHFEDELHCVRSAPDIRAWLECIAKCGHAEPRERLRIRGVDHQLET
jgi:hypothetical protein